jgi:acetylornithine/succinyldiaminopimelate/putrescine aminotransferase
MTIVMDEVRSLESQYVLQTYRRTPITLVRGEGVRLFDSEGREYFDLLSGIGVASLGYAHPRLTAAIADQAKTLLHTSNLFFHPLQGQLAQRLVTMSGLSRAFFCNSGTEAVEACLKFTRRYWYTLGEKRTDIIAFEESFHGRTMGALSVTSDEHYRTPFEPLLGNVRWMSTEDPDAVAAAITTNTAAVIIEPIQGEGGIRVISPALARAINDACARTGTLIIADEVQCGLGRTGEAFYSPVVGLRPDLMSLGKALGAGVPVGAALCFLDELTTGGVMAHVQRTGRHFEQRLRAMAAAHPIVKEVRGAGLMWGLDLTIDAAPVVPAALERGVIVNRTAETVVRLLPPLVISEGETDEALNRLDAALRDVAAKGGQGA